MTIYNWENDNDKRHTLQDLVREILSQVTGISPIHIKDEEIEITTSDADLVNSNKIMKSTGDVFDIEFKLLVDDKKMKEIEKAKWYLDKNDLLAQLMDTTLAKGLGLNFTNSTIEPPKPYSGMKIYH